MLACFLFSSESLRSPTKDSHCRAECSTPESPGLSDISTCSSDSLPEFPDSPFSDFDDSRYPNLSQPELPVNSPSPPPYTPKLRRNLDNLFPIFSSAPPVAMTSWSSQTLMPMPNFHTANSSPVSMSIERGPGYQTCNMLRKSIQGSLKLRNDGIFFTSDSIPSSYGFRVIMMPDGPRIFAGAFDKNGRMNYRPDATEQHATGNKDFPVDFTTMYGTYVCFTSAYFKETYGRWPGASWEKWGEVSMLGNILSKNSISKLSNKLSSSMLVFNQGSLFIWASQTQIIKPFDLPSESMVVCSVCHLAFPENQDNQSAHASLHKRKFRNINFSASDAILNNSLVMNCITKDLDTYKSWNAFFPCCGQTLPYDCARRWVLPYLNKKKKVVFCPTCPSCGIIKKPLPLYFQ